MKHDNLNNLRHSAAHLLAAAVLELYPDAKLTIGPAIENGFYYDIDFPEPISEEDLPEIEAKMAELLPSWNSFEKREVSYDEAKELYKNNPYKVELIEEIHEKGPARNASQSDAGGEPITLYKAGNFEDLCRGGHSENPSEDIGAFKLLNLAGAYWRGSEKNKMLTRIYGTAFTTQEELNQHLEMLEEAKKRDHKRLGKQLELFFFHETSPGMAYWLPNGLIVYNELYNFTRKMYQDFGYQEIATPQLNKKDLYITSGHWTHYRDDMFISPMSFITHESDDVLEGSEVFGVKPMNCPNAMNIFSFKTRSYNDLPMRLAETSSLHRFELSGTLNGLFRIRQFRQDDAHIFMRIEQVKEEFERMMDLIAAMYTPFDLSYKLRFGTRPEKFMGEAKDWDQAEQVLEEVLQESGQEYVKVEGEGAFYGPKVDILMRDSLGREWQTGTIQLDFQQPKNFELKYIESDGGEVTPVVFHRAIYGSFERFLGILVEHFAGLFPLWLSPVQVAVLPVSDKFHDYAQHVTEELRNGGIRVELNSSNETLGAKIREATLQKVPYQCIIGGREVESAEGGKKIVSVRTRNGQDLGSLELDTFIKRIQSEIETKL